MNIRYMKYGITALCIASLVMLASGCKRAELEDIEVQDNGVEFAFSENRLPELKSGASEASGEIRTITLKSDTDEMVLYRSERASGMVLDNIIDTKGAPVTTDNLGRLYKDELYTRAYTAADHNTFLSPLKLAYEENKGGMSIWRVTKFFAWPKDSGKLSFWAWAPNSVINPTDANIKDSEGKMTFTYTMPTPGEETEKKDAEAQKDIILGHTVTSKPGNYIEMTMDHALTALRFEMENTASFKVKSITLGGVYSTGTCTYSPDASKTHAYEQVVWSNLGSTQTYTQDFNQRFIEGSDVVTKELGPQEATFMVIPQCATGGNQISLDMAIEVGGETKHYTASLNNEDWKAGKSYLYKLDVELYTYTLIVTGDVTRNYNSTSGPSAYEVTANTDWQLQYSLDNGANWNNAVANQAIGDNGWIKFDKVNGTASESAVKVNATVSAASGNPETIHIVPDDALNNADQRGTEDAPWDLSMHDIQGNVNTNGATTANSYVVSAPGWYAFPLIYGNAIKNGANNTSAYMNTGGTLSNFIKADGNAITSPYIEGVSSVYPLWEDIADFALIAENGCTVLSAQDAANKGLTALNCQYVMFKVERGKLKQGNVLLAASNGSNIVWSWHIWFTASDLTPTEIKNRAGSTFKLLPANLGWVDDFSATDQKGYPEKTLKIRFIQKDAKGQIKNEVQKAPVRKEYIMETTTFGGSSPYWQWGRKDPFIRCNGRSHDEIPSSAYSVHSISEPITKTNYLGSIASSIQNPTVFYASGGDHDWYGDDGNYRNLWGATNTGAVQRHRFWGEPTAGFDTKPVKTVYDPCPPGYQIPQGNTFTGFINTNDDATSDTNLFNGYAVYGANSRGETVFLGFKFKTGFGDNTIYIPSVGCRDGGNQGYLGDIPTGGNCWTAVYFDLNHVGNRLYFNAGFVCPIGCNPTTNGFQVRPMKEE